MTTKLPPETYLEYWRFAESQEFGIEITCEPAQHAKLREALYDCRSTFGGFEDMMIASPKPEGTIFILHKSAELPQ